jgi:CheY-like chemotaxis protein
MMMPDTDGREFLQLAKNHPAIRKIPLIFFSAGSPLPDIKKKLIKEADDYLEKPFAEEDLLHAIEMALEKKKRIIFK